MNWSNALIRLTTFIREGEHRRNPDFLQENPIIFTHLIEFEDFLKNKLDYLARNESSCSNPQIIAQILDGISARLSVSVMSEYVKSEEINEELCACANELRKNSVKN